MRGVVIVAAGRSERFGEDKLKRDILGKTVLERSVEAFLPTADEIVLVTDDAETRAKFPFLKFASGGATRAQSAENGLAVLSRECDLIAVHDGARPFVSRTLTEKLFAEAERFGSAVPYVPLRDTVYDGKACLPLCRDDLFSVQTPQVFAGKALRAAYAERKEDFTDDSRVYFEKFGNIHFVAGETDNVKITYPNDLPAFRTGTGFDVHPLADGGALVLGGVQVEEGRHLVGHSDADVVVHSVMDALLSASGNRDIGVLFPDTEAKYKGISSLLLLAEVADILAKDGFETVNVSVAIAAERPKLAPFIAAMAEKIAGVLHIAPSCVNVSATTTEKLGIVGEGKGISATATALLKRSFPTI